MARGQLAYYDLLEDSGQIRWLRTRSQLADHWQQWSMAPNDSPIGLILAMEGADPIVCPEQAEEWFELGLRAVNLVHYGHNQYAAGTGSNWSSDRGRSCSTQVHRTAGHRPGCHAPE